LEVVPSLLVPVEELTRSSSNESLLPEAISEALGISFAEVMDLHFRDDSEEEVRSHLVWDAIDRRRMNAEDEACLEEESQRARAEAEMVYSLLAPHYFAQCKMSCKILCRLLKFCTYF
jgi:hypothetical protein